MADTTNFDQYELPQPEDTFTNQASADSLAAGQVSQNLVATGGNLSSGGYKTLVSGWYLGADGSFEAQSAVIRGSITAASGSVGGWNIANNTLSSGNVTLNSSTEQFLFGSATSASSGAGIFIGKDGGVYKFRAGDPAGQEILWDGTNLTISGSLSASSGTIGGFNIGADYIRDVGNSMGLASTVTGGNDVRFWAGDTYANRATAPFTVKENGLVTASNIVVTGGSIDATILSGIVNQANLNVANQGWTTTTAFSVSSSTVVAWTSGTFTDAAGTAYSISSGNTGTMSAKNYIYLDTATSITAFQVTTTAATAVGAGKVLIAVAQNNTTEATFQVFGGPGGLNVDGSSIVTGSITANEIAASTITAGKLNVSQLSAITADMGAITAGTIVIPSGGYIRSGQTDFDTGTGFWLGVQSSTPKMSIGTTSGKKITWDGSNLLVVGGITPINMVMSTAFENATRFITSYVGSTIANFGASGVDIDTGITNPSIGLIELLIDGADVLDGEGSLNASIRPVTLQATHGDFYIGLGPTLNAGASSFITHHCGFKIVGNQLYATQGDGSTESATALVSANNSDQFDLVLKIHGNIGSISAIDYYYRKNGGAFSAATTLTSNPPNIASSGVFIIITNTASATDTEVRVSNITFSR